MAASYSFAASQIASGGAAKREQKEEQGGDLTRNCNLRCSTTRKDRPLTSLVPAATAAIRSQALAAVPPVPPTGRSHQCK